MKKQTKRLKPSIPILHTRDDAEFTMNELANVANNQRQFTAKMDAEILAVKVQYEAALAACALELQIKTESLRVWAETNPDQFPKDRKSIQFTSGLLGFRTGNPKLSLLNRKWKWETVLGVLKTAGLWIRTKEEIDKEAILAEYAAGKYCSGTLSPFGLAVTQEESFYIEPDLTPSTPRQISEAA